MTRSVSINPEAEAELDDTIAWRERERSGSGLELRHAVAELLPQLAEAPERYPLIRKRPGGLSLRRAVLPALPYSIVFIEADNRIRVLAFAHHRRAPQYWRARH